jgi:hypothetical protein
MHYDLLCNIKTFIFIAHDNCATMQATPHNLFSSFCL